MHKSNSFPDSHSSSYLDQAYERAWQRLVAAAQEAALDAAPADPGPSREARAVERLLSGPGLRRALRKPLAWLFSIAQGLAADDPLDQAAVQRVGAATYARLSGRPVGFREADLLSVFALLFDAFDAPTVVDALSAALDGAAPALAPEPISLYVARIPEPRLPRRARRACPHPHCPFNAELGG